MTGFRRLVHIDSSVSLFLKKCSMACLAQSIWSIATGGSLAVFSSRVPWYAVAWSRVRSFAPWVRNSLGICRSIWSGRSFPAPLANLSLSSFPKLPW